VVDTEWDTKRHLILRCAAEVFTTVGYERGTTRQIAERAGLSQSSIYHYVGSKKEMLGEIAREVDRTFTAGFDEAVLGGGTAAERLSAALRNFVRDIIANLNSWAVYWEEQSSIDPEILAEVVDHKRMWVRRYRDLVRECQGDGILPSAASTMVLTEAILGAVAGIYRWYRPGSSPGTPEVTESVLALFGLSTALPVKRP
jgi:TetR/AcrR family transcriptional regulator, cholesterol catabolism regulator